MALSGLRFLALPVGRSDWPVLVPCPLSLLVVSLVVPCFFGCVSSLCLKRTGAPTPKPSISIRYAQEHVAVVVIGPSLYTITVVLASWI